MEILDRFSEIIAPVERPVVVELGAHDGRHTELLVERLRAAGAAGKAGFDYTAVEPDARILPQLRARRLPVTVIGGIAVGARDETGMFWLSGAPGGGFAGSSSIRRPTGHTVKFPTCAFEPATVEVRTLDTLCPGDRTIDFIWADIQGAEARNTRPACTRGASGSTRSSRDCPAGSWWSPTSSTRC